MMTTTCLILSRAIISEVEDDEIGAAAAVGVGSACVAEGAWVGGIVIGGIGDAGGAGFADPVTRLQASKTRIETIQIALLKIFMVLSSLRFIF